MTTNDRSRAWLITRASSGFGQAIAEAALARGDAVLATARSTDGLKDLVTAGAAVAALDVTDAAQRDAAVASVASSMRLATPSLA